MSIEATGFLIRCGFDGCTETATLPYRGVDDRGDFWVRNSEGREWFAGYGWRLASNPEYSNDLCPKHFADISIGTALDKMRAALAIHPDRQDAVLAALGANDCLL